MNCPNLTTSQPRVKPVMPRLEIALSQICKNANKLTRLYGQRGISLMGVSKAVLGEPLIVQAMINGGIKTIADSRVENIQRMKGAGIIAEFVLLRTALSQAESIVENVDISLNTEIETLRELSHYAKEMNKIHEIIIMVEMGDLREGVLPNDLSLFIKEALTLSHLRLIGIGCNLTCYGGIKPDNKNMRKLSNLSKSIEVEFQLHLKIISGGNSANYEWSQSGHNIDKINNLRLGESILLGRETVERQPIPGLFTHAFQLVAEVIESKFKDSQPTGQACMDAFGGMPHFQDRGIRQRAILSLGKQDVMISGLKTDQAITILGASSDHLIVESDKQNLQVGDEVKFDLSYNGLLSAMTSQFIQKQFEQ